MVAQGLDDPPRPRCRFEGLPIASRYGFHLMKVAESVPASVPPFALVRDDVSSAVLRKKIEQRRKDWVRKLRSAAIISIDEAQLSAMSHRALR